MKQDTNTRKRLIAKAVVWETISNLVCFALAYLMFGNIGGCIVFSLVCFFLKLVMFYYHERAWSRVSWGKKPIYGDEP